MGKSPEKFRHGGKNAAVEMGKGRKNSGMVRKIPAWLEKKSVAPDLPLLNSEVLYGNRLFQETGVLQWN
jgi:hypothetical protein